MPLQTGDRLHGFTVTRIRESAELSGRVVEMTYDKTGTALCWVDNGLENKLFSIAFKTLPENSTGVFHILEHSVLCGSKKYPVREPFVELLKSSMNTFLNAMTFPDKTMYPVSSRNTRDFLNLTEVYLDAVFAPAILHDPNIFRQEGWHIEQNEDGTLSYKGVVFNEMKGALSSPDDLCEYKLLSMLFPDTCYGHNSGGDPAVIPSLTYEAFLETYHRFYHPSNARVFLDGDIPLDETLALLDEYLSQYDKSEKLPQIQMQKPVAAEMTQYYELAPEEELDGKRYLTAGKILGTWEDRRKLLAFSVLKDAVAGTNDKPIKRALLSAGLAQEISFSIDDSLAQSYFMMHCKNIPEGREQEILPLIRKTAEELLQKGLDRKALEASLNRLEFRVMEPDEPQGLDRCINCMNSWLHGGDPMMYLTYEEDFAEIRKMLDDGTFETLLQELFIDGENMAVLHSIPSYTRGEELRQEEADRLADIRAGWEEKDFSQNLAENESLLKWQQTPDSPAQLATLPTLPLTEVNAEPSWTETELHESQGVTVLYHQTPCRGIVYLAMYFPLTDFALEDYSLLAHAGSLFCKLPTANYEALTLQQELESKLGRLDISLDVTAKIRQRKECTPMLAVRCAVLREKLAEAERLIPEVLLTTDFTRKDKIREILVQADERAKQIGIMSGHALGLVSTLSRYSARGAVRDAVSGYSGIRRLHTLVKQFDTEFDAFSGLMQRLQKHLTRAGMTASVTAASYAEIGGLLAAFPEGEPVPAAASYAVALPEKMGCQIPAQIGFAVQGWQMQEGGFDYTASYRVAAKIISLSFLWNAVRVQGGAYGTGLTVMPDGGLCTYSYRDPTPAASLDINKQISEFLRAFCESGEPLDKFIISTVSDEDPLRSPGDEGTVADVLWLAGKTKDDLRKERAEMLGTTTADLLESCKLFDAFAAQGRVCVVAAENQLADCENLEISSL